MALSVEIDRVMSDARLRELERRWRETRAVEDEAAYLLGRVRVGDLPNERLRLAAYLGHDGARHSIRPVEVPLEPSAWVEAVCALSDEIAVRVALAASRWAWRAYESGDDREADDEMAAEALLAIQIAEHWLLSREPQEFRARLRQGAWLPPPMVRAVAVATASLGRSVDPSWHTAAPRKVWAARAVQALLGASPDRFATEPIRSSFAGVTTFDQVRALLADELLPWALASEPT